MDTTGTKRTGKTASALACFPDGKLAWRLEHFCEVFEISESTWCEMHGRGEAPATFKIGEHVMLTPQAVQRWLVRLQVGKPAPTIDKARAEKLAAYLDGKDQVTSQELLEQALGMAAGSWTLGDQQLVGRLMKRLGLCSRKRTTRGWVYCRTPSS